jgi:hypothetical protein
VLTLVLTGCPQAILLDPNEIAQNNDVDIIVSLTDGRQIQFTASEYQLTNDEQGHQVIRGKGRLFQKGQSQFESFDGDVLLDDTAHISTSNGTLVHVLAIVAASLAGVYLLLRFMFPHGFAG